MINVILWAYYLYYSYSGNIIIIIIITEGLLCQIVVDHVFYPHLHVYVFIHLSIYLTIYIDISVHYTDEWNKNQNWKQKVLGKKDFQISYNEEVIYRNCDFFSIWVHKIWRPFPIVSDEAQFYITVYGSKSFLPL